MAFMTGVLLVGQTPIPEANDFVFKNEAGQCFGKQYPATECYHYLDTDLASRCILLPLPLQEGLSSILHSAGEWGASCVKTKPPSYCIISNNAHVAY